MIAGLPPRAGTEQPRLTKAEDLPPFIENLCRPSGPIQLRPEDAELVAMLDMGGRQVTAVWAGEPNQRITLVAAIKKVESAGYIVGQTLLATREAIALCSESNAQQIVTGELEDTEATRRFDELLAIAVGMGASDLHLQMHSRHAEVRVRVNGDLHTIRQLPHGAAESIARAMYSQADVDSRRHKPSFNPTEFQDTSISRTVMVNGRAESLKLRWASGPVWPDSFDVALRILNIGQDNRGMTLEDLGFEEPQVNALTEALKAPVGVMLMCGATGEGKSTTMAALADMWGARYQGRRMVRTIEDPPEYLIRNARHMPVSRSADGASEEGFHVALRAAMRMDPDALLLGEIRDAITADLLEQAILTGHKVFATLHAGTVFNAIWRLEELGVKRARLAGEGFINVIANQVLVPSLCPECSIELKADAMPSDLIEDLASQLGSLESLRSRGPGCSQCIGGIANRQVLASLLIPDPELRQLILEGREAAAIERWATGQMSTHSGCQSRSIVTQALDLISKGVLCPRDAEMKVGSLRVRGHA